MFKLLGIFKDPIYFFLKVHLFYKVIVLTTSLPLEFYVGNAIPPTRSYSI